jgi:hypothetical protein
VSGRDDLRFYGIYNLVEVKATGRVGLYTGGVLAPSEKGGDWMEVRFEDGSEWRYRPKDLKKPRPPNRIFDTERYAFTKSAPEKWRRVWDEWCGENAVCQLMGSLEMYAERQLQPRCWADEEGLLGVVKDIWFGEGVYGHIDRYTPERLRLAWQLTFHEDLPADGELEAYLTEVRPVMAAHREMYFHERDASHAREAREQLSISVASGHYQGAPTQIGLPGLD